MCAWMFITVLFLIANSFNSYMGNQMVIHQCNIIPLSNPKKKKKNSWDTQNKDKSQMH